MVADVRTGSTFESACQATVSAENSAREESPRPALRAPKIGAHRPRVAALRGVTAPGDCAPGATRPSMLSTSGTRHIRRHRLRIGPDEVTDTALIESSQDGPHSARAHDVDSQREEGCDQRKAKWELAGTCLGDL